MRIFYRADGNAEIGTGHFLRGILIGRELARTGTGELLFCSRDYPWARQRLADARFPALWLPPHLDPHEEVAAVRRALAESDARLAVADVLDTGTEPDLCAVLGESGLPVVTFDDTGPGRMSADAIINFLVRDPDRTAVDRRGVTLYEGPEYATLVPEYAGANEIEHPIAPHARTLLVSMGGGDAAGFTLKTIRALALCTNRLTVTVVVGSAYPHRDRLDALAATAPFPVLVRQNVPSLLQAFRQADMAVVAGGLTMHEALATGTPAIALCQDVWHQEFLARLWASEGVLVNLGRGADAAEEAIAWEIDALAADPDRRRQMSRGGQRFVDGRGTQRVAAILGKLGT